MSVIQHKNQKNLAKIILFKNKSVFDKFSAFLVITLVYFAARNGSNSFGERYFFLTVKIKVWVQICAHNILCNIAHIKYFLFRYSFILNYRRLNKVKFSFFEFKYANSTRAVNL